MQSVLEVRSLFSGILESRLSLPIGTVCGVSGERKHTELFYKFTSKLSPGIIYHLDMTKMPYEPKVRNSMGNLIQLVFYTDFYN